MTTHTQTRSTVAVPRAGRHVGWFALGSFVSFLIPYVGLSVLDLQHDAFYLLYFCVTLALLGTYTRVERIDLRDTFTRNWAWSIGIGVGTAVALWRNGLVNSDATSRPHGAYFAFEVLWRGVGYGIVDALLLTAFPLRRGVCDSARQRQRHRWSHALHRADSAAHLADHSHLPPGLPAVPRRWGKAAGDGEHDHLRAGAADH